MKVKPINPIICVLKTALWYLLVTLLFFEDLQAQYYIADIQKLSVEDGLSSRFATSIHKDSRGFMWIGTRYGLNRYDGYEFKLYTKENSALTTNHIGQIYEDAQQQLWFAQPVNKGLFIDILNPNTGRIQKFDTLFKTLAPFKAKEIRDVYADTEKTLWIITTTGKLYWYKNNRFKHVFTTSKLEKAYPLYAGEDFLWVSQWPSFKTLTGIDLKTETVKTFDFSPELLLAGMDNNRTLWLFHSGKKIFLKANWEKHILEPAAEFPPKLPDFASSVTFTNKHYLNPPGDFLWWLSNSDNSHTGFPIAWQLRENIHYNFQDHIAPLLTYKNTPLVEDACLDMENRLWLATDDGILCVSLKKNKFTTITASNGEMYSARGIVEDNNGIVYVSTYSGELRIHPEKGLLKENDSTIGVAVTKDHRGNIWFSSANLSVEKYDPLSGKSQYYNYKAKDKVENSFMVNQWGLMSDVRGRIWIGSSEGIHILEPETGHFRKFKQYNAFTALKGSYIYHFQETGEGIWIAAASGLYLLEPGKGITTRYASSEKPPYHIPYNHILHFYRDTAGIFWLATKGGGLVRFDPATGNSRQFTSADGFSSNIIYAVYEDDYGTLWLPSNYGLMQFDKSNYQVNTYLKGDGIAHNEFNTISHYRGADGRLYFGGLAGVTAFHPKDFTAKDTLAAPLRITACRVLNGKTGILTDKTRAVFNGEQLVLSPSDRSFIVEFALLNYNNTKKNSYTYTITGLDETWTTIEENRLRINALPYGKYTLRIKGRGIKGESAANELLIPVVVRKPFYLQNGFILSVLLALGLCIYGIFRWRVQRLRHAKIRLQETVRLRTREISRQKDKIEQQTVKLKALDSAKSRFFTNISHELRTPLTLILGHLQATLRGKYGKIGTRIKNNLEASRQNSHRLLNMIEEILDLSKMEAGKLELQSKPVQLYALIDRLCDTFHTYIKGKHIHFSRNITIARERIVLLDEKKFEKILTNLLSNAVKFTEAGGSITVNAEEISSKAATKNEKRSVKITVRDTGKGIHPNDLPHIFDRFYQGGGKDTPIEGGTGIGLALSKELAELFGGSLSVESQPGAGSTFTFICPVEKTTAIAEETDMETESDIRFPKAVSQKPNTAPGNSSGAETPTILIVEDHPEMRNFIRQQIEDHYQIIEAGNGMEALEVIKKQQPDLILSDVMMPRMDGFQLLSTLKANPATAHIGVIMLTARAAREDRLHALTIGVDDYLTKPFDEQELRARIQYSLRNRINKQRWNAQLPETEKETLTADRKFLNRAQKSVIEAMSNPQYAVTDLAEDLNLSQRQVFRKIKAVTGLSPVQFIREIRLQKARSLLESKTTETVAEVMYEVGFRRSDYFARVYRKRFGKLPSAYFS